VPSQASTEDPIQNVWTTDLTIGVPTATASKKGLTEMTKVSGKQVKQVLLKRVIVKTVIYMLYLFFPLILHFLLTKMPGESHSLRMGIYSLCCIITVVFIDRPVHLFLKQVRNTHHNQIFAYASAFKFYCVYGFPFMILIDYEFYFFTYGPIIICIFAMYYFAEALTEYGEINMVPEERVLDYFKTTTSETNTDGAYSRTP
jgi:hypothetical protein